MKYFILCLLLICSCGRAYYYETLPEEVEKEEIESEFLGEDTDSFDFDIDDSDDYDFDYEYENPAS